MTVSVDPVLGSGLIVEVPKAQPIVGEDRSRLDGNARLGVPAHITVLFPFMPPVDIDEPVLRRLADLFAAVPAFEHLLVRTSWFDEDVLWLAPEGDAPFRQLTELAQREFPDYLPFGGQYEAVVAHLTIAHHCPLEQMPVTERLVREELPISCVATAVSLMVQRDASGTWSRAASFARGHVAR